MAAKSEVCRQRNLDFAIDERLHVWISCVAGTLSAGEQIANNEREGEVILRVERVHFFKDSRKLTVDVADDYSELTSACYRRT